MGKDEEILKAMQSIEKTVNNVSVRMQRVERKLIGDKEFSTPGLIDEVAEHKKAIKDIDTHIQKEKLNKAKQKGIVIGLGAASGGLVAWIKSLFAS